MRKRNLEFTGNIGKLSEEISRQDLETINGGSEEGENTKNPVVVSITLVTITDFCNHIVTKEQCKCTCNPGHILTVTKDCLCNVKN